MFGNIMAPQGGQPTQQLPASMPGGPWWMRSNMGPLGGAAMGALGGAMRGMSPGLPSDPRTYLSVLGGNAAANPQLLAALLGR